MMHVVTRFRAVYLRLGRFADAVNARRKLIALSGESGERQSDLGEALVAEANGLVTAEAKSAFERAYTRAGRSPRRPIRVYRPTWRW